MLAKKLRFHGYGGVRAIQRQGQTVREPALALKYLVARPAERPIRVAVVVGRKVTKSAPLRNRIRRRLYEAVQAHQQRITGGADLVLSGFDLSLATVPFEELERRVQTLLDKAGLLTR